jgi:phosphoadenosine phosphosulfate reductase
VVTGVGSLRRGWAVQASSVAPSVDAGSLAGAVGAAVAADDREIVRTSVDLAMEAADEFAHVAEELEGADALEICRWAVGRFGHDVVVASSFQDCVLIDLAVSADPAIEVVFLDTGFHFPETISYMRQVERLYGLNLTVVEPGIGLTEHPCGTPHCCEMRKVVPLVRVLSGKAAWITGLKRVDTPERVGAPVVAWEPVRQLVKINPMATWTDAAVDRYVEDHDLPRHPLNAAGYVSIGCAPMTRPIAPGEDPRAGRWPDSDKTECGLHL